MLKFVPTQESHVDKILDIYNYYIANSTATFSIEPLSREEMKSILFSGLLRFPSYAMVVDEKIVGYVLMNRYKPREAYDKTAEVTVYLHPDEVGKGYGNQAMSFIEGVAVEYQFHALLGVICAENTESVSLFKKHGYFQCAHFREVGEKFNRVLDVLIYEKLI